MQIKFLKSIVENLINKQATPIIDLLIGKKHVNEFLIAKKLGLTINQTRNILYKLSDFGLVSFIRKKDKRKGWYIYYWTLDTEKCLIKLEQALIKKIEGFNSKLQSREAKNYYICKSCNIEVGEETALEHGFSCEECADVYELSNKDGPIKEVKAKITKTEKNLEVIQDELKDVRAKQTKKRGKEKVKNDKIALKNKIQKNKERKVARDKQRLAAGKSVKVKEKKKKGIKKKVKKISKKKSVKKKKM
jgi:transcription factor E